jgi:hypothetical protein
MNVPYIKYHENRSNRRQVGPCTRTNVNDANSSFTQLHEHTCKNTSKSKILVKKLMPLRDFSTFLGYRITLFIPPLDLVENSGPPMDYQRYGTNIQI